MALRDTSDTFFLGLYHISKSMRAQGMRMSRPKPLPPIMYLGRGTHFLYDSSL